MSQYPPYETCNLGYAHILPEFMKGKECTSEQCWCCSPKIGKWISTKKSWPTEGKRVLLAFRRRKKIHYGELFNGEWYSCSYKFPYAYEGCQIPTHYMHLPEPPK